jgi:hypothetical protein
MMRVEKHILAKSNVSPQWKSKNRGHRLNQINDLQTQKQAGKGIVLPPGRSP